MKKSVNDSEHPGPAQACLLPTSPQENPRRRGVRRLALGPQRRRWVGRADPLKARKPRPRTNPRPPGEEPAVGPAALTSRDREERSRPRGRRRAPAWPGFELRTRRGCLCKWRALSGVPAGMSWALAALWARSPSPTGLTPPPQGRDPAFSTRGVTGLCGNENSRVCSRVRVPTPGV